MATPEPTHVVITRAQRDAIFEEIDFAFECACELPLLLEYGPKSIGDRGYTRDLIWLLQVSLRLLDQLGWQRSGNRPGYVVEVDADVDRFAARLERYALVALEDNRRALLDGDVELRETARQLIDNDLDALEAARIVRAAYRDAA
jgi:hypothetical protein